MRPAFERLAPVGRAHGLVPVLVQELDDAVPDHLLVLDDEDPVSRGGQFTSTGCRSPSAASTVVRSGSVI